MMVECTMNVKEWIILSPEYRFLIVHIKQLFFDHLVSCLVVNNVSNKSIFLKDA